MPMKFEPPKGFDDYYPPDMALRRWIESHWRDASIRSGFQEVDGPIAEYLDLYRIKSGEGIVSELFHFTDRGDREMALRPEFTPTLARMVAEKANSLPRPIKWFCMPNLCRAENTQRGRRREFLQWNADIVGSDSPLADAEVIFTAVDMMRSVGLKPEHVRVRISHRAVVRDLMLGLGLNEDQLQPAFELLDRRDKMDAQAFGKRAAELGLDDSALERFNKLAQTPLPAAQGWDAVRDALQKQVGDINLDELHALHQMLEGFGLEPWCDYDLGIVRGLAYYTGSVFEIHTADATERAIAGGGRYDHLIEMFGGPPTPAVGFGMGNVVLELVLQDLGLIPEHLNAPADVFVMVGDESARPLLLPTVTRLRDAGLHVRFSYKSTTKIGKLLKEAGQARARFAVILDARTCEQKIVAVKNLTDGQQVEVPIDNLIDAVA
jgi:histidyl-tRNA synthetase